ncbi:nitrate reductase subunit beta, partial [Nocardia sp. NPDC004722]
LAIAKYEDRYVIPTAAMADAQRLEESALPSECSLDYEGGPGMGADGPLGGGSGRKSLPLVTIESFHAMRKQQTADEVEESSR